MQRGKKKKYLTLELPKGQRAGQAIFNFLEALRMSGHDTNQNTRMADPFDIPDGKLEDLWNNWLLRL